MIRKSLAATLAAAVFLPACSSTDTGTTPAQESAGESGEPVYTYWRDAKPVIDAKCAFCHVAGDIAPFALTTYAEVSGVATILGSAIEARTMPPWSPGEGCNEYQHDRSLTDAQQELLLAWLGDGAPEGDPAEEPGPIGDEDPGAGFVADVSLTMPEPYTPVTEPDEYRCFVIPWDGPEPYVTGFQVVPGQRSIVHHVIAFAVEPDQIDLVQELDDQDPGPGYACYGGSGVPQSRWIGAWAPGGGATVYPEGMGVRLDPGSKIVMQVHYNTSVSEPIADASSIELSLADTVERPLLTQPVLNLGWVLGFEPMTIPAGDPDVSHTAEIDLREPPWIDRLAELGIEEGEDLLLHSVGLHMHELGVRGEVKIVRAEGAQEECLLEIPAWDFGWQGRYELVEPVRLHPGDTISLRCSWDNSAEHQAIIDGQLLEPIDVEWGEGTRDEMCLGILGLSRP